MKRRVRKIANFFAFNLLFFALYLNFIHKDKVVFATEEQSTAPAATNAAFSGTVLVKNPEIGKSKSKKDKNIRQTMLHKRIILIYRTKPRSRKIELLLFWNTYRHPSRLKL